MGIPKLWGRKPGGVERGFVYSHVLTTYYNWKNKVLLKDKLDDMDRLIAEHGEAIAEKLITNEKFAETLANYVTKAMMTGQDVDNANMVPNSAFIHTLAQKITENQTAISTLNRASKETASYEPNGFTVECAVLSSHIAKIKITGSAKLELGTSNTYALCGTIKQLANRIPSQVIKYVMCSYLHFIRLLIDNNGNVHLGYSQSIYDGRFDNLQTGENVYIDTLIMLG